MSTIEIFWKAIADKTQDTRTWYQLNPQQQHMVIQSWNLLCHVLEEGKS